ncbi:MAG: PAS domain S-box protein [Nitrospinae bacterium]|nr:PAS domain S-box protein [Nitrospinota bacterium]
MVKERKTKKQPIDELTDLRKKLTNLQRAEAKCNELEHWFSERVAQLETAIRQLQNEITEHRKIEKSLIESERLYRNIVVHSKDAIITVNQSGAVIYANPACESIFGYSPGEFITDSSLVTRTLHSDYQQQFNDFWGEYKAKKLFPKEKTEWARLHKDGHTICTENFFSNVFDDTGDIIGFQIIVRDITDRKLIEMRLNLQYNIVRILSESINVSEAMQKILHVVCENGRWVIGEIWLIDKDNDVLCLDTIWNKPLLEASEFEAISKKITFQNGIGLPGRVWESGKPAWIIDVGADTNFLRWSIALKIGLHSAFAFPIKSSGEVMGVMSFFSRDVEPPDDDMLRMFDAIGSQIGNFIERRRGEENIKIINQELQALIHASPVAIISLNSDKNITIWNRSAERIFGWTKDEVIGKPVPFIPEDKRAEFQFYCNRVWNGEVLADIEIVRMRKDGSRIYASLSVAPLFNDKGDVNGLMAAIEDITERKEMEKELRKIHLLESVGILAGGIAHDFNNLLTAILGNISLAKMFLNPKDRAYGRLSVSESACEQAKELSYRLLTFSKGGEPIRQPTLISKLVKETVDSVLANTNISCECNIPDDLYLVKIDTQQMKQVISHLIKNALEAITDNGLIRVYAKNITISKKDNLPIEEGDYVRLSVEDNGRGIPEENLPKIFDPYFSTKEMGSEKGMGLGLSICYSIIKKHEGFITVESTAGKETTFHVYLPGSRRLSNEGTDEESKAAGIGRILIMDDESFVRDAVGNILKYIGYEVEYSANGDEAVELYKKAKDSGKPFDAVILDLTVPGGMGGEIAIRKLLEINPEVKGIVSSGYADNPVMTDFRKYGFTEAITKPYTFAQMNDIIKRVLNR